MQKVLLCLVLAAFSVPAASERPPSVHTTSGKLIGKRTMVLGKAVNLFLGVPYALPPVADLRFKAPVEYKNKDGILETQNFRDICLQPHHIKDTIHPLLKPNQTNMSENCLYLNVYVPKNIENEELPVMVWLSGEGFSYADPTQFDGSFLASSQKIIVVTVSYRVAVFGFLNGLIDDAPGNVGLWDQRLALKWVQENIRSFGGNPAKVTLSGRFSGAMSIVIHAGSPISKQESLFQRIILHSGVPDGNWVFNSNPLNAVTRLAEDLNCVFSNFNMTISCMKRVPAELLLQTSLSMFNDWRPSLDFNLIAETHLSELLKNNNFDVDVLIGMNSNEGSFCLTALKVINSTLYELIVQNKLTEADYERLIAMFVSDVHKESKTLISNLVSFVYEVSDKSSHRNKFIEFCGDLYINALSGRLADLLSHKKQVFVYKLDHRPSFSNQPSFIAAAHGDDVLYSFGLPLQIRNLPQEEIQLTHRILKAMSNFIRNGNPNAVGEKHWPPYGNSKMIRRFDSYPGTDEMVKSSYVNAVHFWQILIPRLSESICSNMPVTAKLVGMEDTNDNHDASKVSILGKWISNPMMEYIVVGLSCMCALLLLCVVMALIVILRHTSSLAFRRLK